MSTPPPTPTPLRIVWGYDGPASLRVRVSDGDGNVRVQSKETGATRKVRTGCLEGWRRVLVQTSLKRDGVRRIKLWELAPALDPAAPEQKVGLHPFAVAGRFRVVRLLEGREATAAWRAEK